MNKEIDNKINELNQFNEDLYYDDQIDHYSDEIIDNYCDEYDDKYDNLYK